MKNQHDLSAKERKDRNWKKWLGKNREKRRRYLAQHHIKYYAKNKKKISNQHRARRKKVRDRILTLLGGKCARCKEADPRILQIDHIKGGGGLERRECGNQKALLERVIRSLFWRRPKYQILCANCNLLKKVTKREGMK